MGTTHIQRFDDGSMWLNSGWKVFPFDPDALGIERRVVAEKKTCKHGRFVYESYELSTIRSRKGNLYPSLIHRRKSHNIHGTRDDHESIDRCIAAPQTEDSILTSVLKTAFQFTFANRKA